MVSRVWVETTAGSMLTTSAGIAAVSFILHRAQSSYASPEGSTVNVRARSHSPASDGKPGPRYSQIGLCSNGTQCPAVSTTFGPTYVAEQPSSSRDAQKDAGKSLDACARLIR